MIKIPLKEFSNHKDGKRILQSLIPDMVTENGGTFVDFDKEDWSLKFNGKLVKEPIHSIHDTDISVLHKSFNRYLVFETHTDYYNFVKHYLK